MSQNVIQADVVIVGSGIIGQSIALEARRVGLRVVVIERPRKGAATPAAAGMLTPSGEAFECEQSLIEIATESCRLYPDFVENVEQLSGHSVGYKRDGTLMVALTRDHVGQLEQLGEAQNALGLQTRWLKPQALKEIEPNISPRQCGALLASNDHQVNPGMLFEALRQANQNTGTQFVSHTNKVHLDQKAGLASGVSLETHSEIKRIESPWVVAASGAWSSELEPLKSLPLRPVRGQYVRLQGAELIKHVIRTPDVYMVPRDDGVLYLGASSEESGFDQRAIAGHAMELLWHAFRALPGVYELEMLETAVGFRPALRDHLPAIGHSNVPGLLTALGHYRHGIMLAPITATGILEIIQTNRVPRCFETLAPGRFQEQERP